MASFRIPRLVGKTNKSGLTSWYWQPSATLMKKGWRSEPLGHGGAPDSPPEHVAAAARAKNVAVDGAAALAPAELRKVQRPLTVDQAFRRWEESGFASVKKPGSKVSDATARQYRSKGSTIKAWGKGVSLASVTAERVAVLRDALMKPVKADEHDEEGRVRHHAAHETLRVGRTFFTWLEQERLVAKGSNPFADFALAAPDPRDNIWWQPQRDAVLAAAAEHAEIGKFGRLTAPGDPALELALDLAFAIGQREADLLKLQIGQYVEIPHFKLDPDVWEQLAETTDAFDRRRVVAGIRLRQNKGKVWVEVPVVGATRARIEAQIAAARKAGVTSLLFDRLSGLPWTMPNLKSGQTRFIRRFGDVRAAAIAAASERHDDELARELGTLQFRDFRRSAVVFLGELGIADHLIAAITGHTLDETKKILETYMPRTTGMAARAIALSRARAPEKQQEQSNG